MPPGSPARRLLAVAATVVVTVLVGVAACTRTPEPQRHPLPRLPALGSALLPGGFVAYDRPTAQFASRHPVHVDSAFFELGGSDDLGGHHCRAQVTVSPYDAATATPAAHTDLLGTKLCDSAWFVSQNAQWRQLEPGLWTADLVYSDVGWFGVDQLPAVGVVAFAPERGAVVGVWALTEVYPPDRAVDVARDVLVSLG
ncbi:MAG: hypothetical protein ACT4RN_21525, partial [Pseudonocardia sp.]